MNIYAVVLHYKDKEATKACVASLKKYESKVKIIVIDNDKNNVGFAAGVNIGIKKALSKGADGVFLLNNDTFLTQPIIPMLTEVLTKNVSVGIVGPALQFEKNGQTIFDIGGFIHPWIGKTYHAEVKDTAAYMPRKVLYISGAAMLIKKEVFEKIGYFDEGFFLYYEDVDFCIRASQAGFTTMVIPHVSIYHSLSKTAGKLTDVAVFNQIKSAIRFGGKYFTAFPKNICNKLFILLQSMLFVSKNPRVIQAILSAHFS